MHPLDAAILRTILYADVFEFPLTVEELHRYLITATPCTQEALCNRLQCSPELGEVLVQHNGYVGLHTEQIIQREEREVITQDLWPDALRYGRWFARIPFVRMVALTGSLAARNPLHRNDDFDYFLIATPGRVWMARALAIVIVRIVRLSGRELCPNYVLSQDHLEQKRHDLFMAREIQQMIPLYGAGEYTRMMQANAWCRHFLPNASCLPINERPGSRLKRWMEYLLHTRPGDWFENWECRRKTTRFAQQQRTSKADVRIDADHVKGHFMDHGERILQAYEERLQAFGLAD